MAMPLTVWHSHEMIFGFAMAVVAGFLLTAVMNWTGLPTLRGTPFFILGVVSLVNLNVIKRITRFQPIM